ncbi:MAG: DUF1194 domain-containing protein [Rhodobacter sp.]|nr:DUF1194 domain-containing protein [Rhodobacter sp.]
MRRLARRLALLAALAVPGGPVAADGLEVDLELILMVDVSRSMTERELEIQRRGYAEALQSDPVFAALQSGLLQRVAMAYVEWAGWGSQRMIVDWRLLQTRADLDAFARTLTAEFDPALRRTSISGALLYAAESLDGNAYDGLRRVIDVSGDGPNNQGRPVERARDAVIGRGITVNGLPLMTQEGMGSQWHLDDLDAYYRDCVIGGPGAFLIPVHDWDDFAEAVKRKLVLEMVWRPPPGPIPAQYAPRDRYDCLIGEKIWERYFGDDLWLP